MVEFLVIILFFVYRFSFYLKQACITYEIEER